MASIASIPTEDVLSTIAPDDGAAVEEVETPEGGEPSESEGGEHVEGEHVEPGTQPQPKFKGVDKEVGAVLERMKAAKDPAFEKVKAAIYSGVQAKTELAKLTPHFPNGVADVLELKEALDQLPGGAEDLEDLGNDIRLYQELDQMLQSGDPRVLENLTKLWPDAVRQIGPAMFDKLATLWPEWYNQKYADMVVAELVAENVPQSLVLLRGYLEPVFEAMQDGRDKLALQRALGVVGGWNEWIKRLGTAARAQVKRPTETQNGTGAGTEDQRAKDNEAKELQLFQTDVRTDFGRWVGDQVKTGIAKIIEAKKADLSPHQHRRFAEAVLHELNSKMRADKTHEKTVANYERKRDKEGLMRYLQSRVSSALKGTEGQAGLIQREYGLMFKNVKFASSKTDADKDGKGKAAIIPAGSTQITQQQFQSLMSQGKIDWNQTTAEMRMKNQYILKDGKRVYYKKP